MSDQARAPRGTLATVGLFLLGNGEAIRRLAATPRLWLVGLLLTLSAGLARDYDGEDLLAEPWHLLIAPGASFVAATVLWLLVQLSGTGRWAWSLSPAPERDEGGPNATLEPPPNPLPPRPRWWDSYCVFLGLFWLTAPLAWFYGIPYERFQSAGDAMGSNLWTLQLVALWRVVLMIRVLIVLYGIPLVTAGIIVLLFGDALMLLALKAAPVPIFAAMGGVRLGDAERALAGAVFIADILGTLAFFGLFLAWLVSFADRRRWSWNLIPVPVSITPLIIVALVASGFWCAWLPFTQPEQQLRHHIEHEMRTGDFATGITLLEQHFPADLPPHWDPPPRQDGHQPNPDPLDVLLYLIDHPAKRWIQDLYESKLLNGASYFYQQDGKRITSLVTLLERSPDSKFLLGDAHSRFGLRWLISYARKQETDPAMSARLDALLQRYPE